MAAVCPSFVPGFLDDPKHGVPVGHFHVIVVNFLVDGVLFAFLKD